MTRQKDRIGSKKKNHIETRGTALSFGSYGLRAMSLGSLRSNHLESARKVLTRVASKGGKMWTRVFPDRPYTQKAAEVGMGQGKGDVMGYEVRILPGRMLFELDGLPEDIAKEALRKAGAKLPLKTKVIARR